MHLNHKSNCGFVTAKHGKKIVKRAAGDDEAHTEKQNVFIVTPSKNLDGFLDIVRLANEAADREILSEVTADPLPSTESSFVQTPSTNPFLAPDVEEVTIPVVVRVEEVSTTTTTEAIVKALTESETTQTSFETTQAPTIVAASTTEAPTTEKVAETTQASTESSIETTQVSTEKLPIIGSSSSSSSSSSSESSESNESKSNESKPKQSGEGEESMVRKLTKIFTDRIFVICHELE
jgi:hypothetical protein